MTTELRTLLERLPKECQQVILGDEKLKRAFESMSIDSFDLRSYGGSAQGRPNWFRFWSEIRSPNGSYWWEMRRERDHPLGDLAWRVVNDRCGGFAFGSKKSSAAEH